VVKGVGDVDGLTPEVTVCGGVVKAGGGGAARVMAVVRPVALVAGGTAGETDGLVAAAVAVATAGPRSCRARALGATDEDSPTLRPYSSSSTAAAAASSRELSRDLWVEPEPLLVVAEVSKVGGSSSGRGEFWDEGK